MKRSLTASLVLGVGTILFSLGDERETVLDRKIHIEKQLYDIPQVPRLCDSMRIEKKKVNIGDCELYCEIEGKGLPVLLINGGPGGTHHCFHPWFSKIKDNAEIIYYDQRGCGLSDYKPGKGYSVTQAADDIEKLRKALNIDKWFVLGWSYGGLLAQYYTIKYPESVRGLILVGASPGNYSLNSTRQFDYLSPEERKRINEIYSDKNIPQDKRLYNAHMNGDWKRQVYYRPSNEELARQSLYEWSHHKSFRNSICGTMSQIDMEGLFKESPIPTLICEGKWDLTWNTDKPALMQSIHPKAKLVLFEKSGHGIFMDEPDKFSSELTAFMKTDGTPGQADLLAFKKNIQDAENDELRTLLRNYSGKKSESIKLARAFSKNDMGRVTETNALGLGMALYDAGRYEDALEVFGKMKQKGINQSVSLIWQAHMLDLLGRRNEAVELYKKVVELDWKAGGMNHDQYKFSYSPVKYAQKRIEEPFTRIENTQK